jgi:hypothetical protein
MLTELVDDIQRCGATANNRGGEDRRTPLMLAGTPGDRDGHDSYRSLTRVLLSNFLSSELL